MKLLNVFPTCKQKYHIAPTFEQKNNRFLEETQRQTGWMLTTEHGEEFFLPLKKFEVELYSEIEEDKPDVTGIRNNNKRKDILNIISKNMDCLNARDMKKIQDIYEQGITDIHNIMVSFNHLHDVNVYTNKTEVTLNLTNPRVEASPLLPDDFEMFPDETEREKITALASLNALRRYYEPNITRFRG